MSHVIRENAAEHAQQELIISPAQPAGEKSAEKNWHFCGKMKWWVFC